MAWIVQNNPFQSIDELYNEIQQLDELQKSKSWGDDDSNNNISNSYPKIDSKLQVSSSSSSSSNSDNEDNDGDNSSQKSSY